MNRLSTAPGTFVLALLLVGCTEPPLQVHQLTPTRSTLNLVKSDCGGRTELLDSRIDLTWDDALAIRSDGGGVYKGGSDGVHGKIFYHDSGCSRSADAVFDPDMNPSSAPRKLVFHFPADNTAGMTPGGVAAGPFMNFAGIMRLGSDVTWDQSQPGRDKKLDQKYPGHARSLEYPALSAVRPGYPEYGNGLQWSFDLGIKGCERLRYDEIVLTRTGGGFEQLPGQTSAAGEPYGQWSHAAMGSFTVKSAGAHAAQCLKASGKQYVENGAPMTMPFHVTITERRP